MCPAYDLAPQVGRKVGEDALKMMTAARASEKALGKAVVELEKVKVSGQEFSLARGYYFTTARKKLTKLNLPTCI